MLVDVALTLLQSWTNGQMGHLLHLFIPGIVLLGLLCVSGGSLALINLSFMLGGVCKPSEGGGGTLPFGGRQCSP